MVFALLDSKIQKRKFSKSFLFSNEQPYVSENSRLRSGRSKLASLFARSIA
jgi:hypothetical protein